jgi:hypothetical protein
MGRSCGKKAKDLLFLVARQSLTICFYDVNPIFSSVNQEIEEEHFNQ